VAVLLDDEVVHGVEFRHLRYLVAIADAGRFTHAAERMFVTQPTLSHQIRRSEEMAGTPLLHRRPEGVRLTEAGSVLVEESRTMLALLESSSIMGQHRITALFPVGAGVWRWSGAGRSGVGSGWLPWPGRRLGRWFG
jgi:DNA-binding transcriptional LysR family regulator